MNPIFAWGDLKVLLVVVVRHRSSYRASEYISITGNSSAQATSDIGRGQLGSGDHEVKGFN